MKSLSPKNHKGILTILLLKIPLGILWLTDGGFTKFTVWTALRMLAFVENLLRPKILAHRMFKILILISLLKRLRVDCTDHSQNLGIHVRPCIIHPQNTS
jgi:hypothetical protein